MATDSHILAWRIPWAEEPGRLQSVMLFYELMINIFLYIKPYTLKKNMKLSKRVEIRLSLVQTKDKYVR